MDNATEIHKLLVEKAHSLDLPKAYHRDLDVHDLESLQRAPNGQILLWGIGECGTHMIRLSRLESPAFYTSRIHNVDHWYVIQDGKLDEVK